LPTPDDYVGNFMETYYKTEYEQQVYLHVGPVVGTKREVWVLNHNSMYAEDLSKIIVGDLSHHMTKDASHLCLDEDTVTKQLVVAVTWVARSVKNYMMQKYDSEDSDSEEEQGNNNNNDASYGEPTPKRPRNEPNTGIDTKYQGKVGTTGVTDNSTASLSTGISNHYTEKIAYLEQQVKSQSEQLTALTNAPPTAANNNIDTRFQTLQETIETHTTTVQEQLKAHATELASILEKIELTEIKTKSRFDTVYDTMATKNTELDTKIQGVSDNVAETNIENRRENQQNQTKLDKI
jgi:hypothetical protein